MNTFRVLFIDDDLDLSIDPASASLDSADFGQRILAKLHQIEQNGDTEVWGRKFVNFYNPPKEEEFHCFMPPPLKRKDFNLEQFLSTIDVLILDLRSLKYNPAKGPLTVEQISKTFAAFGITPPTVTQQILNDATNDVSGIAFLHQYFDSLQNCRAIFILTAQDGAAALNCVSVLIDRLCCDHQGYKILPWINKFSKIHDIDRLLYLLKELHDDFSKGYTDLSNRGAIEFAASNDLPVLIVGESGTGKEGIAGAIHRTWIRCQRKPVNTPFVIVNCAGLSGQRAQSELFGHVAGSRRETSGHYLGAVLRACGCSNLSAGWKDQDAALSKVLARIKSACLKLENMNSRDTNEQIGSKLRNVVVEINDLFNPQEASQKWNSLPEVLRRAQSRIANAIEGNDMSADFRDQLLLNHASLFGVDRSGGPLDLRFNDGCPMVGTLFLDEFGDLPVEAQALLLRFLEPKTSEIQPFGYGGWIRGIKLRVIAATNNPEVASLAGIPDYPKRIHHSRDHAHSVRYDLVQRIRQIVIRAAPVMPDTAKNCLRGMVSSEVTWSDGALNLIVRFVTEKNRYKSPIFGHRRELERIVKLTEAHVMTGHSRGLRGFEKDKKKKLPLIRDEDVSSFLTPALEVDIQQTRPSMPQDPNFEASPRSSPIIDQTEVNKLRDDFIQFCKKKDIKILEGFNWKTIGSSCNEVQAKKLSATIRQWLEKTKREKSDFSNDMVMAFFGTKTTVDSIMQTLTREVVKFPGSKT